MIPIPTERQVLVTVIAIGSFSLAYFTLPIERETGEYANLRPLRRSRNLADYAFSAICFVTGLTMIFGRNETFLSVSLVALCLITAVLAWDMIASGRVGLKAGAAVDRDRNPIQFWLSAATILIFIGAMLLNGLWGLYHRL